MTFDGIGVVPAVLRPDSPCAYMKLNQMDNFSLLEPCTAFPSSKFNPSHKPGNPRARLELYSP